MLVCCEGDKCKCMQHQLLHYLKKRENKRALSILRECPKLHELINAERSMILHFCVDHSNVEMMKYFLDHAGYSSNYQCLHVRDQVGDSPLVLAADECLLMSTNQHDVKENKSYLIWRMIIDKASEVFTKQDVTTVQWLLEAKDSVKLLVVATASTELANFALDRGYPIDFQESQWRRTALHIAILFGQLENAKILIKRGAEVNVFDWSRQSPLGFYLNVQALDQDSTLLKGMLRARCSSNLSRPLDTDIEELENQKELGKLLGQLLWHGNRKTVETVMTSGIDVEGYLTELLLYYFIGNFCGDDVLSLLDELNIEFDVDQRDKNGLTTLMHAARSPTPDKVEYLLEHGADVNSVDSDGCSVLMRILDGIGILNQSPCGFDGEIARNVELLLQYGARDASLLFTDDVHYGWMPTDSRFHPAIYVIVGHLAMLDTLGQPPLSDLCRTRIEAHPPLQSHFELCISQLETMKRSEVYGSLTLFDLLTETDEKLVSYARNPELIEAVENSLPDWSHLQGYYYRRVKNRLERAEDEVKLRGKVALAIGTLTELSCATHPVVFDRVINYLTRKDKHNLCKI